MLLALINVLVKEISTREIFTSKVLLRCDILRNHPTIAHSLVIQLDFDYVRWSIAFLALSGHNLHTSDIERLPLRRAFKPTFFGICHWFHRLNLLQIGGR